MSDDIAWQGEFEFLGASWNDRDGRMVMFRVVEAANDKSYEHPFKHFTRKRSGRTGTRFILSFARPGEEEGESCEVMLVDWTENAGGRSVKFWVDPDPDRHPFEALRRPVGGTTGDTLMVALVELGDDDTVQSQTEMDEKGRPKQRLSNLAAMMCREPAFHAFLAQHVKLKPGRTVKWNEEEATRWVRHVCEVESRSYLDRDPIAAAKFHEKVRKPYQAYREHHYDQMRV